MTDKKVSIEDIKESPTYNNIVNCIILHAMNALNNDDIPTELVHFHVLIKDALTQLRRHGFTYIVQLCSQSVDKNVNNYAVTDVTIKEVSNNNKQYFINFNGQQVEIKENKIIFIGNIKKAEQAQAVRSDDTQTIQAINYYDDIMSNRLVKDYLEQDGRIIVATGELSKEQQDAIANTASQNALQRIKGVKVDMNTVNQAIIKAQKESIEKDRVVIVPNTTKIVQIVTKA